MPIVDFAGALAAGAQDNGGLLILAELTMHSADFKNAIHAGPPAHIELELFDGNQQIVSQARVPFQQLGTMLQGVGPSIFDAGSTAGYTVTLSADTFV